MLTNHHLIQALAADRQQTLRHEARQHHLARVARRSRSTRRQPTSPARTPLPAPVAPAAWQQDRRAA